MASRLLAIQHGCEGIRVKICILLQAMLMPNTKPGFNYYRFLSSVVIIFPLADPERIQPLSPVMHVTILHGVELFLITISHNNYGMLENVSRLSTPHQDTAFAMR